MSALTLTTNTPQPASVSQSIGLVPQNLDQAMRLAEMMARGKLVPEHLRNPADALMVVELAMRFGMSPFAVAQATSVIQGKLMLEGKLVSAAVHSSGILSSRLSYAFSGEGAGRRITVTGTIRGESEARTIDVDLKDAKTTNQMWSKQPDQQLVYFATRAWARRHVPEVMLGVYSPEEFDAPPPPPFRGTTIEAKPTPAPAPDLRTAINDEIPDRVMNAPAPPPPPKKRTTADWLNEMAPRLAGATDLPGLDAVVMAPEVKRVADILTGRALDDWEAMLADNVARLNAMLESAGEPVEDDVFPGDRP